MRFSFDGFDRYEIPTLVLANPNFEGLHVIRNLKDQKASIRFNGISDFSFYVDKTPHSEHYFDLLTKKRLIHVDGFGWFVILSAETQFGWAVPRKQVDCVSYDATLTSRPMNIAAGTYVFYNPAAPDGTLLNEIFDQILSWHIGYVSPSLYGKARTFDMPDTNVHTFLTSDAAEAYECVFLFDNETRTVNAYTVDELVKDSGVMMRFNTIMKDVKIKETRDEIVTALSVYGASDFSINNVNPLGTPTIYKFDYYRDMMTPDLWDAVRSWEVLVQSETLPYANFLTELKQRNVELLAMQADLAKMRFILDSGKQVRDVQTPYVLQSSSNTAMTAIGEWIETAEPSALKTLILSATAYPAISLDSPPSEIAGHAASVATVDRGIVQALINIWACERIMVLQEVEIEAINTQIEDLRNSLIAINDSLSFENNFTLEQREELEKYIFGTDFVNEYCVIGDYMTYPEIQDIAMELLEQGKNVLDRVSQPTYEFNLDAVNYLFNKKYEGFINQTELGSLVHAEIEEDKWVNPIILEVNINWSQPDEFSMKFGNRYRLQSSEYLWADLNDEMSRVSANVSSEFSALVAPSRSGMNDSVSALLSGSWDASKNAVLAGDNQSLVMDRHGLLGRKMRVDSDGNPTGFYEPKQFRMINNLLVFTDDNWQNCKLALGEIELGDGTSAYGIAAEVIMGTLLAGNNLVITNESGSFKFDGNGATLTNASMSVISDDGLSRIFMDSTNGFRIQTRESDSSPWSDEMLMSPSEGLVIRGVTELRVTTDGLESRVNDAESSIYTLSEQTAEAFTQMVRKDGVLSAINQSAEEIKIQASKITLEGLVTANNNFRILADGSIEARNATINGTIRASYGNIGGFEITSYGLYSNGLTLNSSGRITFGNYGYVEAGSSDFLFGSYVNGQFRFLGVVVAAHLISDGNIFAGGFYGDSLYITGTKNALVKTRNYGSRLINAYETAEYYFADIGEDEISNGECVISLDPIFCETVNTSVPYQVKLTPYGDGRVWLAERRHDSFVVRGDNIPFGWEIAAKRLGYENHRLEEPDLTTFEGVKR